jgi:hypothetical protein
MSENDIISHHKNDIKKAPHCATLFIFSKYETYSPAFAQVSRKPTVRLNTRFSAVL